MFPSFRLLVTAFGLVESLIGKGALVSVVSEVRSENATFLMDRLTVMRSRCGSKGPRLING